MNNNFFQCKYGFNHWRKWICVPLLVSGSLLTTSAFADDGLCPPFGWKENLKNFQQPDSKIPTKNTPVDAGDCDFHEWSWEAFVWATTPDGNGTPRFLSLATPDEIPAKKIKSGKRTLRLATRSHHSGGKEIAGAIVEADGNMLVAPNGYPVLASVHMNKDYFDVVKNNMLDNGDYMKNFAKDDYFPTGAAVFKATWLRLDPGQTPPAGTYTTQAEVPKLTIKDGMAVPVKGEFFTATVALLGLHVVGTTINHPEFLWATFEHNLNAPMIPDNTFSTGLTPSNQNYTLYKAFTPFTMVNIASNQTPPANLYFNEQTQKFSPTTNVVQENKTGGENFSPNGPQNIANLNAQAQSYLQANGGAQSVFANYSLIGTVWMAPNTYVTATPRWWNLNQSNALGSVNLANSTAETFVQQASNSVSGANLGNCFMCHNASSFAPTFGPYAARRVGISHIIAGSSSYSVQNQIPVINACQNINAGPLWDNKDAQAKCPTICSKQQLTWNNQWKTTEESKQSVCGCCN